MTTALRISAIVSAATLAPLGPAPAESDTSSDSRGTLTNLSTGWLRPHR